MMTNPSHDSARRVRHLTLRLDGHQVFYRDAGPRDAPVVLLPHGYPCSSYEFRNLMPLLADRWRLIAPDFPGFGYSDTPDDFSYSFAGYTEWLDRFVAALRLDPFVLYLHDYGSQIGLRLAIANPRRIAGLVIQNGDIYEDVLGPKYEPLKAYFDRPTPESRRALEQAVSEQGYREEFLNEVEGDVAARIPPDLWKLHWALTTPKRREIGVLLMEGLRENLQWFPRYQAYLREHRPPALICWGPRDGYMPEPSARAYLRDLPDAELHVFEDGGHWLLETHLDEVADRMRGFLDRVYGNGGS